MDTIAVTESECALLIEAIGVLLPVKQDAMRTLNAELAGRQQFQPHDFGIPTLEQLRGRLLGLGEAEAV